MLVLKYLILLPANLVMIFMAYLLSPFLALLSMFIGPNLPWPLTLFYTHDDDLDGGQHQVPSQYPTDVDPVAHWIQRMSWICRNPAYGFAASGKYIRDVDSVTLSATTGTAGSFGVTATRYRGANYAPVLNARFTANWADLGLPEIPNSSCLFGITAIATTSTGSVRATGKIIHG